MDRTRLRFGPFEVDLKNRELWRQGLRLHLQRQPFAVLETLLESPGDLVTRDALRQRLWPDGTYVEFDKGLNTAVMKLRDVLGEDSHSPYFIETVAREGYRFVAAVETVAPASRSLPIDETASPPALSAAAAHASMADGRWSERRASDSRWTAAAWSGLVVVLACALI